MKKVCFLLFPTSIALLLLTVIYRPFFFDLILSELSHSQSSSILKHIFKVWKQKRKLILYYGKVKETYFPSFKAAKQVSFLGTKSYMTKTIELQTSIFFRFFKLYVLASI